VDQALSGQLEDVLLEGADPLGSPQQLEHDVGVGVVPVLSVDRELDPGRGSVQVPAARHRDPLQQ
jgi:hypothetical protein